MGCKGTQVITHIIIFGIPEMILYTNTFYYIIMNNQKVALSRVLNPDVINRRKQRNKLNILITFWAWLAQLLTSIVYFTFMKVFFGKERFIHILLSVCTICLNFNMLPLFYLLMADDDFKTSIISKDPSQFIKMLFGIES